MWQQSSCVAEQMSAPALGPHALTALGVGNISCITGPSSANQLAKLPAVTTEYGGVSQLVIICIHQGMWCRVWPDWPCAHTPCASTNLQSRAGLASPNEQA